MEIKFRGKRLDGGEWVYGSYLVCVEHGDNGLPEHLYKETHTLLRYIVDIEGNQYLVDPNTIGQSTNLFDKNGVEIFVGDITIDQNGIIWEIFKNAELPQIEKREIGKSCGYPLHGNLLMTVIGNIHDNPELLNQVNARNT